MAGRVKSCKHFDTKKMKKRKKKNTATHVSTLESRQLIFFLKINYLNKKFNIITFSIITFNMRKK